MIFYFSGTGNSRQVAEELGTILFEETKSIEECGKPSDPEGESVGFVFPVYSWGVPPNVERFIKTLPEAFFERIKISQLPVWVVMTCGDEVAMAPEMMTDILRERGVEAQSIWSVQMPNNYVLLPGFDVDSKELEKKKLHDSHGRIAEIAKGIKEQRKTIDVVRGSWPRLKTGLVYPLFKRWGIQPKKWKYTSTCVGCGICARSCPQQNVAMVDRHPVWGPNCCSCLACYHSCPRHAVEYGKMTAKKGQYFFVRKTS